MTRLHAHPGMMAEVSFEICYYILNLCLMWLILWLNVFTVWENIFAQPNFPLAELCLRFTSPDVPFVIFVWDFSKSENVYIFVRKFVPTIPRNWRGSIGWESCGSLMSTYCNVTSKKIFSKWSSSCINLSLNFLKITYRHVEVFLNMRSVSSARTLIGDFRWGVI